MVSDQIAPSINLKAAGLRYQWLGGSSVSLPLSAHARVSSYKETKQPTEV